MRAVYVPLSDQDWATFYLSRIKHSQTGHGDLEGFQGLAYQRGHGLGSLFKGLFRLIVPVFKSVGKMVGSEALSTGANIASDLVRGRNIRDTLEDHGRNAAGNLLDKASSKLRQQSGGLRLGKRPASNETLSLLDTPAMKKRTRLD